ncbi:MAG: hypothetical protein HN623_11395 [Bdellovibrionales bacterium]|nr:hypothetical protein [Bdellovibrionales bacterium]
MGQKLVKFFQYRRRWMVVISSLMLAVVIFNIGESRYRKSEAERLRRMQADRHQTIYESINRSFQSELATAWPSELNYNDQQLEIEYTFHSGLTKRAKRMFKRYRPDHGAVVIIDNATGEILTAIGYQRQGNRFNNHLPFSSTHPSASLIKIVTAAELLSSTDTSRRSVFSYRGKGTTLYKYQLRNVRTKWTRYQTFERAFAFSNNVIFGKAAIKSLNGVALYNRAMDFGFNQNLMNDVNLPASNFMMPENQYNLAELASGFNRETTISPVHAASLVSIVANGGELRFPRIISNVSAKAGGSDSYWNKERQPEQVLDPLVANELRKMMDQTVKIGPARGSFSKLRRKLKRQLYVGGKTGTLTGGTPHGKRDWFVAYAIPRDQKFGAGISVCVMNINIDKWYVRSAYVAKDLIEYYYKHVSPLKERKKDGKMAKEDMNLSKRQIDKHEQG